MACGIGLRTFSARSALLRIKIIGLVDGSATPFAGQYLVEYDPARAGSDPLGEPMTAHLVTTPDPAQARLFANHVEALECWQQSHGTRPDGKPSRPLTAFHVVIEPASSER